VAFNEEIVVLVFNYIYLSFLLLQLLKRVQEVGSWSMMSLKQSMNLFKT